MGSPFTIAAGMGVGEGVIVGDAVGVGVDIPGRFSREHAASNPMQRQRERNTRSLIKLHHLGAGGDKNTVRNYTIPVQL
jgi:hypothetical protein